ncbi:MAG: LCP family protein [Erysipelotrichaceae bacterium]|nr:LCP family protein [Erysipelotrichaceae bacterium]
MAQPAGGTGNSENTVQSESNLVYEGVEYTPKKRVETTLIMGIDVYSDELSVQQDSDAGVTRCDFLAMLVTDKNTGESRLIHLNRDMMADVDLLGSRNEILDTQKMQLCLAHAYGTDERASARNTMHAVSRLFANAKIDHFITLTMDAVPALNDAVGGVPVLVEEDFSQIDPSLVKGETVTLKGEQALNYVRGRQNVDNGTNEQRMARQRKYMASLFSTLSSALENGKVSITSLLTDVNPYMTSDMSVTKLNEMFKTVMENPKSEIEVIEGQAQMGKEFVEFHPDEKALMEKTISLFYEPVKNS